MRKIQIVLVSLLTLCLCACNASNKIISEEKSTAVPTENSENVMESTKETVIDVQINSTVFSATLNNNSSAKAFEQMLNEGKITISMQDYGNFEKVGELPNSIEANDEQITTEPGDIILYEGNKISVYYDTNTWNLTRLGKLNGVSKEQLTELLGKGDVKMTFRLHEEQKEYKTLVAYFSATGNTRKLAEYIQNNIGADMYEIIPAVPYTEADIAYYTNCRADREQNDASARPEIKDKLDNMDEYDTVYLGYPIWHGQAPRIISTFLESYDFSGKTIIPFCTSHSSGLGSSDVDLHKLAPDAVWKAGQRFNSNADKDSVLKWAKQ